jgi:hypothetical protein
VNFKESWYGSNDITLFTQVTVKKICYFVLRCKKALEDWSWYSICSISGDAEEKEI